jgi:hypothetical protein
MFKDYVLNKNKTIQKKHDACSKPHIEATLKAGNNLVLEFSTAAYELAKQTLSAILDKSMLYYGLVRNSEESSGANVDTCIKVYNRKGDNTQGKNLKFVINLYHTYHGSQWV